MSLVSEALRKARAQQHRRELEAGQLPPVLPPPSSPRRSVPAAVLLAASILSGAAGAGVVALFVLSRNGKATTENPAPQPSPPRPAAEALPPRAYGSPKLSSPTPAPAAPSVVSESPAPKPAPTAVPSPTPAPTSPPSAPAPAAAREFVVEGKLGGAVLHLDFLVYGSKKSFARINGQDVVEGSVVEGYTVEAIQEDRVILRGAAGLVILKVR